MQPTNALKIKLNTAAKQFNRYNPQRLQQSEEKIKVADSVNLLAFLDYPPLFNDTDSDKKNLSNLERLRRQMKFQKVRIKQRFQYNDLCYYQLLSKALSTVKVKEIKSIKYIQELEFEQLIPNKVLLLFNTITTFNKLFFEAPWRSLYPILSEYLAINKVSTSFESWENLELGFKFKHGNLLVKSLRLTLLNLEQRKAIVAVDYQLKTNLKATPKWAQMEFILVYQLGVWQIKEIKSDYFFE